MEINIMSNSSSMKKGSFCGIVNVNKEKQRWNNTILRYSASYPIVRRFKCPYFSKIDVHGVNFW